MRRLTYIAPRWRWIYRVCKMYVDNFRGDNNSDMLINGEVRFLRHFLQPRDDCVVFDVGANYGQWCRQVLVIQPSAQVHCFEPAAAAYEKLLANSFSSNVICNNIGLGSHNEEKVLYVDYGFSELSSLYTKDSNGHLAQETVKIEILSDYCQAHGIDRVTFLKIDVEGHELEVLKGAAALLADRAISAVQFEYGSTYIGSRAFLKDVFEFAQDFDYDFYKILPFTLLPIPKYQAQLETFEASNYLMLLRHLL